MACVRVPSAIFLSALTAGLGGCFFDASAFDGAPSGGAGAGTSTTGAGSSDTTTSHGGSGGAAPIGGATSGGTGGSGAAEGGAVLVIPSDDCPGTKVNVPPYAKVLIEGDTASSGDDYGSAVCGGGSAGDLVYQIIPLETGLLSISLTPLGDFNAFFQIRDICMSNDAELKCGTVIDWAVTKDTPLFVIVDGKKSDPAKQPEGKFQLRLTLNSCGNGQIEAAGEECDDGNEVNDDTCTNDCKVRCTNQGSITNDYDTFIHPQSHHCYLQAYGPNSDWQAAENDCVAWGGHLAALTPLQEKSELQGLVGKTYEDVWIGGNDKAIDGTFAWTTGEPWAYPGGSDPWNSGEPNGGQGENCVEIYQNGRLNDENCSSKQNWMCERPPTGKLAQ